MQSLGGFAEFSNARNAVNTVGLNRPNVGETAIGRMAYYVSSVSIRKILILLTMR